MKKIILVIIAATIGFAGYTQENKNAGQQEYRTLFGGSHVTHGGYGGLSFNYSQVDKKDALLVGAQGAWIINHGMAIGIAGYGFANNLNYTISNTYYNNEDFTLAGGYGGLLIEPIIGAKSPVHITIPVLIGAGGVAYIRNYWTSYPQNDPNYNYTEDAAAYFVFEPGIEVEMNMVKFMRLAIGGHYRFTSDVTLLGDVKPDLNGFSVGLTLKFGKF